MTDTQTLSTKRQIFNELLLIYPDFDQLSKNDQQSLLYSYVESWNINPDILWYE